MDRLSDCLFKGQGLLYFGCLRAPLPQTGPTVRRGSGLGRLRGGDPEHNVGGQPLGRGLRCVRGQTHGLTERPAGGTRIRSPLYLCDFVCR